MQNFRSKITVTAVSLLTLSTLMISCTKEVPYKYAYKGTGTNRVQEKKSIDTNAEYIYVASSDLANQDSTGAANALPFWQGEEKIVKFRFTEDNLQVLQVNEESRLQGNATNEKILLEIPVSHIDYRCAKDRYDKCTNQEEEYRTTAWNQKTKFIPNFDGMKTAGFSLLPIEMDKVFGSSCFNETASQLLGYELTDSSLNVQVQKTFKADLTCIEQKDIPLTSLEDLHTQIVYHYSFTKLDTLASANYQPVAYPVNDESTFGFFTTNNRKYDVDFSRGASMKTQYLNRWNPEKKELVYYMSDNFNKPELKAMKDATLLAFERVNKGLEAAGMETRLVLKDPAQKAPGDIRNSMVVLVEDPVAGGPLGYGPTVANPRTGEIMSGRVAMYYGNYLQNVRYSYDEVVRELKREKNEANNIAKANGKAAVIKGLGLGETASSKAQFSKELQYQTKLTSFVASQKNQKIAKNIGAKYTDLKRSVGKPGLNDSKFTENTLKGLSAKTFAKASLQSDRQNTARDTLSAMSKYCNYPAELFPFNEIVKNALQSKLGADLKPWTNLTTEERKAVIDIIMPQVWLPTLVHELGHNLGLRHNFGASEDKVNFYSKDELHNMGVQHEIPYASVMDYGYSELNLLPTLGKYDIAALRFGYKREIDTTTGKTLSIKTHLDELKKELAQSNEKVEFKDYQYCSDEHVSVNPNCKRFDRGTNLTEILDHLIQSYEEYYAIRNFRNGREYFSRNSDAAYYGGTVSRFIHMRAFMERYESVKNTYRLADDAPEWESIPFLKDLKTAAIKSGEFLIKVLHTPEQTCAIATKEDPSTIVSIGRLDSMDPKALSCFDIQLRPEYVVIGEAGKSFNSKKDPASDNHYADQIDVRGIWPDKLAAARVLLSRQIGNSSYDKTEDNYVDISELSEKVPQAILSMLLDNVVAQVTFRDAQGLNVATGPIRTEMFSTPEQLKASAPSHWIETPLDERVAKAVGIPMQQTSFQEVLLQIVADSMKHSQSHRAESQSFLNDLSVIKTSKAYQLAPQTDALIKDIAGIRYVALPENSVAQEVIGLANIAGLLEKLTPEKLTELIAEKKQSEAKSPTASKFSPEYQAIPLGLVTAFQQGLLPSESLLNYLLTLMPSSN